MRVPGPSAHRTASNFVSERLFRYLVHLEVEKAVRLRYYVSVVCLSPDLPDQQEEGLLVRHIARVSLRRLRHTDLGALMSPSAVGLLLIDADPRALPRIVDRVSNAAAAGGSRRFVHRDREVSVSVGGGCYPVTAASSGELLSQACDLMLRARQEGGDRLLLPSLVELIGS